MSAAVIDKRLPFKNSPTSGRFYMLKFAIDQRMISWLFSVMDLLSLEHHRKPMAKIMSAVAHLACYVPKGNNTINKQLLEQGVARKCNQYITCQDASIKKNVLWTLSNFVIHDDCLKSFLAEKNALERLVGVLAERPFHNARSLRSANWCLANMLASDPQTRISVGLNKDMLKTVADFGSDLQDYCTPRTSFDLTRI